MSIPKFLSTVVVLALFASQASSQVIGQKTYLAGTKDNFTFPTEDSSPSSYLVASDQYPVLDFDQVPYVNVNIKDRKMAHTFRNLPRNISGGKLVLRAMSGNTDSYATEALIIGFWGPERPGKVWFRYFGDLIGQAWLPRTNRTITLDLAALPTGGRPLNVIPYIQKYGMLDVKAKDDTGVDYYQLTLDIANQAPAANAGADRTVHAGTQVTLSGSGTDPEGHLPFGFSWTIVSRPAGSAATLANAGTATPLFTPDVAGEYTVQLVVADSLGAASKPDTVTVVATNLPPVADAGDDQTVHAGTLVTLDGSGSSDPEGDLPLRFAWTLDARPAGSVAALENAGSATPSFTPDLVGAYTLGLVVTDSLRAASTVDTVTVVATNEQPVADAGDDQTAHPGHSVTLDGSRSYDPDGDTPLTLSWEIVASPEGSTARLSDPAAPLPSLTPDLLGEYRIRLTVADRLGSVSLPDEVVVSTLNSAPTAEAGSDQVIIVRGATVQLDGRRSSDPDGDPLSFVWTMIEKPAGSVAALSDPASATPTFVVDLQGSYLVALVVQDSFGEMSEADLVTVSFENVPPVADAGDSRTLGVGETAFLDGSGSFDANGDPLTYRWSLITMPEGSRAALDNPASVTPALVPDRPGLYVISLIVNDGLLDSEPSSLTLTATASRQSVLDVLREIMEICAALDPDAFKGNNGKDTLLNKLNAVIDLVDRGLYEEAREKLSNDLLGKLDGCAKTGEAGPNDLVTDCDAQAQLSPLVVEAIELLRQLL